MLFKGSLIITEGFYLFTAGSNHIQYKRKREKVSQNGLTHFTFCFLRVNYSIFAAQIALKS
jgi:hypothetical protein